MASAAEKPQVFVSYSHRDEEAKDFVGRHLSVLQTAGHVEVWDDRKIVVGDDWYQAIEAKLEGCAVAVLLISTDFLGSEFCIKEEVSRLLERRKRDGMMIAPILLRPCAWKIFPWLAALQMQPRDDTPLLQLDQLQQERELTEVVLAIHAFLKEQAELVAAAVERAKATGQRTEIRGDNNTVVQVDGDHVHVNIIAGPKVGTPYPALAEGAVDLTRLPTSGFEVVGRDKELKFLDDAFDGDTLNVVSLRAWGGVGKSTLVNKWCEYLAADNYRGARRTFAWSFYSQGTNERVTSADAFIDEALRFFGDDEPEAGSPWSKGERLADLVGSEKALLILDGMEPLQDEHQGIKDPALARLVECLAETNAGLCVITTREPVKEFSDFPETTREVDLEQLSKEAGRALLRIKGLRAADDLLEQASEAFGNHALALNLLASYLKRFAGGDVSRALAIPDLPKVTADDGKHPRRVMAAFAEQFGESPELDLLHVMGLFDRPADAGCIAALRKEPAISGLADKLSGLQEMSWQDLLRVLRGFGLLAEASNHAPNELDAHPLVREHFGERLWAEKHKAWLAGHRRLYGHFVRVPNKHLPDTLAEMAPLFQAVHHGCQSAWLSSVLEEIYKQRIIRNNKFYLTKNLGAYSTDLGLIAPFFECPFERPDSRLSDNLRIWLLAVAAFDLRALGRLREALKPIQTAMDSDIPWEQWRGAASSIGSLSELHLILGNVAESIEAGRKSVRLADRMSDHHHMISKRTTLADALHHAGELSEAKSLFEISEAMQEEFEPGCPRLYSRRGHKYCDLLLALGQAESVRKRATERLGTHSEKAPLLDLGFSSLAMGRALFALGNMA